MNIGFYECKETIQDFFANRRVVSAIHLAIIIVGGLILVASANYDSLWFDEAYSVAMASHTFSDIWAIGSSDVHPILYYWVLHCVYLVFGENIYAFRLVSIAGLIVLSLLGFTHIRKEFGSYVGLVYSILLFLIPWSIRIAFQVRMYEWTAVAVMLCAIYGFKICKHLSQGKEKIPLYCWIALSLSSAISAYLHYYGAMAAFCVQLFVVIAVLRQPVSRKINIAVWFIAAAVAVALYLPWLMTCVSQVAAVSEDFWIIFQYPTTFAQLILFPFNAPELVGFMGREADNSTEMLLYIALFSFVIILEIICAFNLGKVQSASPSNKSRNFKTALIFFLGIYVGIAFIAALLSVLIEQPILYYRYISVAMGPVALIMSFVLTAITKKGSYYICVLCASAIVIFAILTYYPLYYRAYDPRNSEAIEAYEQLCEEVQENNDNNDGGGLTLVFTDDEEMASIVAASGKGLPVICMNPQEKYRAFEPRFIVDYSWQELLDNYNGEAILISSAMSDTSFTNGSASSFAKEFGGTVKEGERHYHPYSNAWLIYTKISF